MIARKRRALIFKLRVQGVRDEKAIEKALAELDWEIKAAHQKKKKERVAVNDPANFSVNISQLMYESENNDYGSVNDLEQDLEGVETNFQFSRKQKAEPEIAPLAPDERRARIEKARERLRSKKVYLEDKDPAPRPALNISINNDSPSPKTKKQTKRIASIKKV